MLEHILKNYIIKCVRAFLLQNNKVSNGQNDESCNKLLSNCATTNPVFPTHLRPHDKQNRPPNRRVARIKIIPWSRIANSNKWLILCVQINVCFKFNNYCPKFAGIERAFLFPWLGPCHHINDFRFPDAQRLICWKYGFHAVKNRI